MIGLSDATILAVTKLRVRRIRTLVTVVISGLLFAGLIAALIVAQGTDNSIQDFSKEGFNSRYIVQAATDPPITYSILTDKTIQARAQELYAQTVDDKKIAAKKLGISYDPSTEPEAASTNDGVPGQPQITMLNLRSPAAVQALREYLQAHPVAGIDRLKQVAAQYHPSGFYTVEVGGANGSLATMENGQEDFSADSQNVISQQKDIFRSEQIQQAAPELASPFLLSHQPTTYNKEAIPIMVSYARAAQLLGLADLPKDASPRQQLDRINEVRAKAATFTLTACYRNSVSEEQIQTAMSQAADIAKNQGNKDYQRPSLVYGLPAADSCGQAPVISDTRTAGQKKADAKQDEFNQMFGEKIDPVQQKLTFRIVGLIPNQNNGASTTISGILQNVVGSVPDQGIVIPSSMLSAMPNAANIKSILFNWGTDSSFGFSPYVYYVEFSSARNARDFIKNRSCTTRVDGSCATPTKPFLLNAYGSNSIALEDLRHKFTHYFELTALAVIGIAIVIMTGTVGRMVADGRRETAVFRAIGAKRLDIVGVYGIYTLALSAYVACFALVVGLVAACVFDHHFWASTTVQAKLLFGATDASRQFHFFAINTLLIGLVLVAAIVCGLLSMVFPLLRNVRRSPIKDMREE